jgi:hypothetical protein
MLTMGLAPASPRLYRERVSRTLAAAIVAIALMTLTESPCRADTGADSDRTVAVTLSGLRADRTPLACGAELITVFGASAAGGDVPLVAVLSDTLGDDDPVNDRLRYVWVFSYCPPSASQRVLASIPFFYHGFASRRPSTTDAPPVIFDFSKDPDPLWQKIAWYAMQAALLDPHGWLFQAGSRTYARNEREYRQAHLKNGLSILEMYRRSDADVPPILDEPRFEQVYGRIVESGLAGAFLNERHLADAFERESDASRRDIARNWELLRQRCEEEGLVFDPLPSPPARARHAIVWASLADVRESPKSRPFNARFLNLKSPWSDDDLRSWEGYTKVFFRDADGRVSHDAAPGSTPVEMVPLAVYGLDFPKIPVLLVDFRSLFNPKRRELSRRAIDDVGRYILHVSPFGDVKLYVAQKIYAMVTGRKGMDVGQPSRALTYAQLKTLLALRDELDPELRELVLRDVRRMNVNPLETDVDAELRIATVQYRALLDQVASGALDARVEHDRGAERTQLEHGRVARGFLKAARVASFGLYRHRDDGDGARDRYAADRALRNHSALLAEVARAPKPIEVSWDPAKFLPALSFVAGHGRAANREVVASIETIVRNCGDPSIQLAGVDALVAVDLPEADAALARLAVDESVSAAVRDYSARLLAAGTVAEGGSAGALPDLAMPLLAP